jgi:hypothetical protein
MGDQKRSNRFNWLPLPGGLLATYNWQIDVGNGRLITLRDLGNAEFTRTLRRRDTEEIRAALRTALKEQLLRHRLPESLLEMPINPAETEQVLQHAAERGRQLPQHTIRMRDALLYVGGSVSRLLRCLPPEDLGDAAAIAHQVHTIRRPNAEAPNLMGKSMKGRRQKTTAEALDFAWPQRRLEYSDDAYVVAHNGSRISCRDPRCGRLLVQIAHHVPLVGQTVEALATQATAISGADQLVAQFTELMKGIEASTIAQEIRSLAAALLPARTDRSAAPYLACDLIAAYFGVGGDRRSQEVSAQFGITRSRLSQQVQLLTHRINETTFYSPPLTRLHAAVELGGTGLLAPLLGNMSLRGALQFGTRCLGWQVTERVPSKKEERADLAHAHVLARSMAGQSIAFYIPSVMAELRRTEGAELTEDQVKAALSQEVTWLDPDREWGSFATDPLPWGALQILACAAPYPVDVRDIASGLAHSRTWNSAAPSQLLRTEPFPTPALIKRALAARADLRKFRHNDFTLATPLDPLQTMRTERESKVFAALSAAGGVLTRDDVRASNDPGLHAALTICLQTCRPWLVCLSRSVYAIRGRPAVVDVDKTREVCGSGMWSPTVSEISASAATARVGAGTAS